MRSAGTPKPTLPHKPDLNLVNHGHKAPSKICVFIRQRYAAAADVDVDVDLTVVVRALKLE